MNHFNAGRVSAPLCAVTLTFAVGIHTQADAEDALPRILEIIDGALAPGTPEMIRITEGAPVALTWRTDEPTEIHLHGYDLKLKIEPGQEAVLSFEATASGRYPITLHGHGDHGGGGHDEATIFYIEVYPR